MARLGGIELGGTKTVVALGNGDQITGRFEFPTTTPEATMVRAAAQLAAWDELAPLDAIGIGSFGPVCIDPSAADYGCVLNTPKAGWSGADVLRPIRHRFACPVHLDTDVNAAALAEQRAGAARRCDSMVYLTIGTGIGGGVVIDGKPVHGMPHPEIGHVRVRRADGGRFAGVCPYHGDCMEGLVSGPALRARFGCHPGEVPPGDPRWEPVCAELAELLAILVMTVSPARIVVGGGVALGQPHLLPRAAALLPQLLGGYFADWNEKSVQSLVVPAGNRGDAGPRGTLLLAGMALSNRDND